MIKENSIAISLVAIVCLLMLLIACSAEEPELTSTPMLQETSVIETPKPETTSPAEDEGTGLEATDEIDAEASLTPTASGLTAVINSGDSTGAGTPFTFDATQSIAGEVPIVDYIWTMGDGSTLFGNSVEHAYSDPGLFTVTLIVTDQNGQTDTTAKVVEIVSLETTVTPATDDELRLIGTSWKLDNAMRGTTITLEFDEERISGSAGCNEYDASYVATLVEDATANISVRSIGAGTNSCTPEVMAQERGYLDSLASANRVLIDGPKLTMETDSGTLMFTEIAN